MGQNDGVSKLSLIVPINKINSVPFLYDDIIFGCKQDFFYYHIPQPFTILTNKYFLILGPLFSLFT